MNTRNSMIPMTRMIEAALGNQFHMTCEDDRSCTATPRADILEGQEEFLIVMDMPGVQSGDLDISLEDQLLVVTAERKLDIPEDFEPRRRERAGQASFTRSFTLSKAVDTGKISAKLEEGILKLVLPKSEKVLPRQIAVN